MQYTQQEGNASTNRIQLCLIRRVSDLLLQSPAVCSIRITLFPEPLLLSCGLLRIVLLLCDPDWVRQQACTSLISKLQNLLGFSDFDRSFSWFTKPSKSFCRCSLFASAFFWSSGL